MPELNEEISVDENQQEEIDRLVKAGDIELGDFEDTKEEPDQKKETKPQEDDESEKTNIVEIDGKEYSFDDIREALEVSKNPREFIKKATQQTQSVSKERSELEKEKEEVLAERKELEEKIKGIKESSLGDPAIEKMVSVLETQQAKLEKMDRILSERMKLENERMESERDRQAIEFVNKAYDEAQDNWKDFPDVKIPKPGTKDFTKWMKMSEQLNPLDVVAFKQYRDVILKSGKRPDLTGVDSRPPEDPGNELNDDAVDFARRMGVDPKIMKQVARGMGR